MGALSKATGISAGPGMLERAWNEVKAGLAAAQPGAGLPRQSTVLGNAAETAGMLGTEIGQLGVGPGMAEGVSAVERAIPSAERAGKTFQELKGAIGNHTVAMTDRLSNSLSDIKEAVDTGSTLPTVINKFVTRLADLEKGPLTYNEARQFYSNISDLSASERMASKAKDLRLIQEFKHALGETIGNTAEAGGRLEQYQSAMREFAKSKRLSDAYETAKKTAITAAVGGGAYSAYKTLRDMLGY